MELDLTPFMAYNFHMTFAGKSHMKVINENESHIESHKSHIESHKIENRSTANCIASKAALSESILV